MAFRSILHSKSDLVESGDYYFSTVDIFAYQLIAEGIVFIFWTTHIFSLKSGN